MRAGSAHTIRLSFSAVCLKILGRHHSLLIPLAHTTAPSQSGTLYTFLSLTEKSVLKASETSHTKMEDSPLPVTPRMQQLRLEPSPRTGRSADSGYGSLETSPVRSPKKRRDHTSSSLSARLQSLNLHSYDGNSSEESKSGASIYSESDHETIDSPTIVQDQFGTLPRQSRRRISLTDSFSLLPDSKSTHQRRGSDNTVLNGSRASPCRALDRFIPLRDHATPGSEKLRTTKPWGDLTPSERLVRHNQDAPDPFCFRRRVLPPSPTEARKARASSHSRTILDTGDQADRRVSSSC